MDQREERLRRLAQRHHLADDEAACIEDVLDASRTYEPSGMVLDAELALAADELRQLRAEVRRLSAEQELMQPVVMAAIQLAEWEREHGTLLAVLANSGLAEALLRDMGAACRNYLAHHERSPKLDAPAPTG